VTEHPPGQTAVVEQTGARLHPLTPFVKGWGYFVGQSLKNLILTGVGPPDKE